MFTSGGFLGVLQVLALPAGVAFGVAAEQRFQFGEQLVPGPEVAEVRVAGLLGIGLELRSGLLEVLDIEGTPVMRTWNVVNLGSRLLSPAAEAFRYGVIEEGSAFLRKHDGPLLRPAIR